jgi:hypothetical protein
MERRLISERTRAGLVAARARGRAGGRPTVMTPERLTAALAMRAQGMTLMQIAATLGVGRSSLVRALAQSQNGEGAPGKASTGLMQAPLESSEATTQPPTSSPITASNQPGQPEIQLLGRTARRGAVELEAFAWPAGCSPACPSCMHPTTGVQEQYARVAGLREPVIVALADPCGCVVDDRVTQLLAGADIPRAGPHLITGE